MKPFFGCNSYFLLDKALNGQWEYVDHTLDAISQRGFTVVRIWAFSDADTIDRNGNVRQGLQKAPGRVEGLDKFRELLNRMQGRGLQAMLCLTNCLPDYGGMWQYVRWANTQGQWGPATAVEGSEEEQTQINAARRSEAYQFYTNTDAKRFYRDYVKTIVMEFRDHPAVHSWDCCNEPRNQQGNGSADAVVAWVHEAADWVKTCDPNHPVTVGSEGFFGSSDEGFLRRPEANPYGGGLDGELNEGCDWLREGASSSIDFVCVHPYMDSWRKGESHKDWREKDVAWIKCHADACRDRLGGKPLVVQEFNMPQEAAEERAKYYKEVGEMLRDPNSPVIGTMLWMVAAERVPHVHEFDRYTEYSSDQQDLATLQANMTPPAAK